MGDKKAMCNVDRPERFQTKPGPIYRYHGRNVDLTSIDTATAEALADDPGCMFVQWADPTRRPKHQRNPFHTEAPTRPAAPMPPSPPKKA